jgi:hypothetical protein
VWKGRAEPRRRRVPSRNGRTDAGGEESSVRNGRTDVSGWWFHGLVASRGSSQALVVLFFLRRALRPRSAFQGRRLALAQRTFLLPSPPPLASRHALSRPPSLDRVTVAPATSFRSLLVELSLSPSGFPSC